MAIVMIVALYFAISVLFIQTVETLIAYGWPISREPSPLIGLLQAWCSLSAIWWVTSRWTSHVKTLHAVLACFVIWCVLVLEGERTDFASARGAGWLASLMTQFLGTAVGALLVGFIRRDPSAILLHRFSIMYLAIWTFVIAVLLGTGRWLVESLGWTWEIVQWRFFPHLLVVGAIGALQAVGFWGVLQSSWKWRTQSIVLSIISLATMAGAIAIFFVGFRDAGADVVEICRQFGLQAVFMLATLVPLKLSADYRWIANSATTG
jgi:hypothetical protein